MKEQIRDNLNAAAKLEVLYQQNPAAFESAFREVFTEIERSPVADFWMARLNDNSKAISETPAKTSAFHFYDLLFLLGAILIGWAILKIPDICKFPSDAFIAKNVALSVLPCVSIYWAWKRRIAWKNIFPLVLVCVVSAISINLLPVNYNKFRIFTPSDTFILSCIFLPILWWITMSIFLRREAESALQSLTRSISHTGELFVTMILISLAGGAVLGAAAALFSTIGLDIGDALENFVIPLLLAIPFIAVCLTETYPQLARSLTSILARVLVPLIFLALAIYIVLVILLPNKDVFASRDFLITFNGALLGTAAVILIALCATELQLPPRWVTISNGLLCAVSVILTGMVIYFLMSRAHSGGLTPNRFAAFGVDIILIIHLCIVGYRLFALDAGKSTFDALKDAMTFPFYLYAAWSAFVIFAFPLIFHFK